MPSAFVIAVSLSSRPIAIGAAGAALLAASAFWARHDALLPAEMRAFRVINRLPDWLYWPLWLPMQLGNLVVGALAGVGVALLLRDTAVAVATVIATIGKVAIERVIRNHMAAFADVRQRPGTSEPDAILRG